MTPDLAFDLTPTGSALFSCRRGSLFTQVESILSLLASVTARDREFSLPPGAMQKAIDAYLARRRMN